jgi:hypothetical protein
MSAQGRPTEIVVQFDAGPEADLRELADLTALLRSDIEEVVDVESVRLGGGGDVPAGAKSGDPVMWGTLVVSVVSSGALTALINLASNWVGRQRSGTVRVKVGDDELELAGASSDDQRRLVDAWLARRQSGAADDG